MLGGGLKCSEPQKPRPICAYAYGITVICKALHWPSRSQRNTWAACSGFVLIFFFFSYRPVDAVKNATRDRVIIVNFNCFLITPFAFVVTKTIVRKTIVIIIVIISHLQ